MIDEAEIRKSVTSIIKAIGEDPKREGLSGTPNRVAEIYAELFDRLDKDSRDELSVDFEEGHREMIILRDIPFYSMREHHLLPFYGTAHIGYIPNTKGRIVGARTGQGGGSGSQAPSGPGEDDYSDCGGYL